MRVGRQARKTSAGAAPSESSSVAMWPSKHHGFWTVLLIIVALGEWRCHAVERPKDGVVSFVDATAEAGLNEFQHVTGAVGKKWMPETMGGGGGFIDYNGDGWQDILLVRGATWAEEDAEPVAALALYENAGDGSFVDRTAEAGLDDLVDYAFGVTVADYDDDGDDDFYLTSLRENFLFRNDGGTFVDVSEEAGVAGPPEWTGAAVFLDAELDGLLDLYVGNYIDWSPETDIPCSLAGGVRSYCTPDAYEGLPGRFYHNNGDGTFVDRTEEAGFGLDVPGKTLAATQLDYNNDGCPDLVVANDTERDLLYENRCDGTFDEVGIVSGIAFDRNGRARAGMGVDVGVVDSTGNVTVFVSNFAREMIGAYRYVGNGRFVDRALQARLGQASTNLLSFGIIVFDADLDGNPDLLTANGHISPEVELVDETVTYRQPARLYRNLGDGTFEPTLDGDVWNSEMVARGAAYADYDRDGDVDVLLTENGGPAHLWRNEVNGNGFLRVHLEGRRSNQRGIGARVELTAGSHRMTQFVKAGSSYLSTSETALTFGLGTSDTVDSLTVRWPSGHVDVFTNIRADQEIRIVEDGTADPVLAATHPPKSRP